MYYLNTFFSFFQVTGSAFRPLTNIPHCCTKTHWGFFRPNVVDRPLSHDYGYQLEKSLPFLLLTEIKINILKRTFFIPFFYKGFFPYFKVAKLSFTHLYTTTSHPQGAKSYDQHVSSTWTAFNQSHHQTQKNFFFWYISFIYIIYLYCTVHISFIVNIKDIIKPVPVLILIILNENLALAYCSQLLIIIVSFC